MNSACWLFVLVAAVLLAAHAQAFNMSVIHYDAVEINVEWSEITITKGYLYVNHYCNYTEFSNFTNNTFNQLNISRTVCSITCYPKADKMSASGRILPSVFLLLALQLLCGFALSRGQLLCLALLLSAAAVIHEVQAVFIEVKTNFDTVVFNDFSDLYQPKKSIAVMTIVANNPALNGSQMILAYDPDITKRYTFYFPVNSTTVEDVKQWLVIKENLEFQTILFPSGGCVQLASEFHPLVGYDYIPGHTIWPNANCFVVYSGSLNTVIECAENSTVVFFRNNAYALHYDRPLDEADLPYGGLDLSDICRFDERLDNYKKCTKDNYCECCTMIAQMEESLPTQNCEEMPGGGVVREVCPSATTCPHNDGDDCEENCCAQAGYCPKK